MDLEKTLEHLRSVAVATLTLSGLTVLGIPQSAAITCVKPSWYCHLNLVDSASGIHARHSATIILGLYGVTTKTL
jgi:hypothetical protein